MGLDDADIVFQHHGFIREIYHPITKYTVTEIMRAPAHIGNPDISTMSQFHLPLASPGSANYPLVSQVGFYINSL